MGSEATIRGYLQSQWCKLLHPNPSARIRLVCFPPVGAGASFYSSWGAAWRQVEVCAIQPPGHEQRICEEPISQMQEAVEQLLQAIPFDKPVAFFGHSLGALIVYELTCRMEQEGMDLPRHLLLSACPAPQVHRLKRSRHLLSDAELIRYLSILGGTPEDVLNHKELMAVALPIIRADFKIADDYRFEQRRSLPVPITAFGGAQDAEVTVEEVAAWRSCTAATFRVKIFPGNHFYLHTQLTQLKQEILNDLCACA